jgi:hypothetical protein
MQIEHISIIVTSNVEEAHKAAVQIYENMSFVVTPIIEGAYNDHKTFFIAPCGSYKDHTGAAASETYRQRFKEWCKETKTDYCEVKVGYQTHSVEVYNRKITKSVATAGEEILEESEDIFDLSE